ncbi:SIR2 family protein [Curtobacterium pusillum]|uniref:SIR2 family protein n=1 Tax=Curtobacterium pusillum TaxID=69373 RepID=UPI0011A1F2AE|nr:SIR2 family protein [Curtobacterium pusillum]
MSAPDLTADVLAPFKDSGVDRHVTLLLGAGASTSSGLPGWDELAVRLLLKSGAVSSESAAQELVRRQDPLLVAEAARNTLDRWDHRVRTALYQGLQDLTPSSLHLATAGHALAGPTDQTTVVTLNFDTLLEDAISIEGTADGRVDEERSAAAYVVHHLHGMASPSRSRSVVLTLSDYNELLGDQDCWQQRLLSQSAQDGAIVIAGTSYRDPDVRRWLHVALAGAPDGNAALVLLARQAFGVTREGFDEIKGALASQWRAAGLQPIILEDFTDAAQIIRELRHLHLPHYRSPQERASELWDAHSARFNELQPQYAELLNADARVLRDAFDVDQLGVSLWLADGAGNVGRYASQDRTYRSADDIRRVPSGHDSAWVAGRTLGAESIEFQNLDPAGTNRWGTVFAVPISVSFVGLPDIATAVLSVGLPGSAEGFSEFKAMWFEQALDIANAWSERLSETIA